MRITPVLRGLQPHFLPRDVCRQFRRLSEDRKRTLRDALVRDFFSPPRFPPGYLETPEGRIDLWMHLTARIDVARTMFVPWLDSLRPLRGARVLEIGSGTGSGTVAFLEQGAQVTALDVQEDDIGLARLRCRLHDVSAEFTCANATEIAMIMSGRAFDLVVFYAVLEHMTLDERLASVAGAFQLLADGGILVVFDSPNRLWPFDEHTA